MANWIVYREEKKAAIPILKNFAKGYPEGGYEDEAESLLKKLRSLRLKGDQEKSILLSKSEERLLVRMLKIFPELYDTEPDWIRSPVEPWQF